MYNYCENKTNNKYLHHNGGYDKDKNLFVRLDVFINGTNQLVLQQEISNNINDIKSTEKEITKIKEYIDRIDISYCPICGKRLKEAD